MFEIYRINATCEKTEYHTWRQGIDGILLCADKPNISLRTPPLLALVVSGSVTQVRERSYSRQPTAGYGCFSVQLMRTPLVVPPKRSAS